LFAGIDSHKRTLAVAVVDTAGRQIDLDEFANDPKGHEKLAAWLTSHDVVRVGIEGSGHLGRAASAWLMDAGLDVREVPCEHTVRERRRRAGGGKSDPIDALAIARVTAREDDLVPARCHDDAAEELRILSDYRRQLVMERTRLVNRVHADLVIVAPGYKDKIQSLTRPSHVTAARRLLRGKSGARVELIRRRLDRVAAIDKEATQLKARLEKQVIATGSTLLELPGVGVISAARILGETGDVRRFRDHNAYASANGTAPIPASSGATHRHRVNRGGNRLLNEALHTVALVQNRGVGPGKDYIDRQRANGKSYREAMRSLKRRLSDVIYRTQVADIKRAEIRPAS
jgi:transposase